MKYKATLALVLLASLANSQKLPIEMAADRKPHTITGGNCLIAHGKVFTISGAVIEDGDVLIRNGKIERVGRAIAAPPGFVVVNATGKIVLPGLVDAHSHRGESESNEYTDSAVPEVMIRDVLNPEEQGLWFDLANGTTSSLLLHGSADAIGGQSIIIKNLFDARPSQLVFPGAPRVLKFALGENVTQKNDDSSTRFPQSRMGVEAVYRRAFADARAYTALWNDYRQKQTQFGERETLKRFGPPPRRDMRLETISEILKGNIWIHCHSYRQDEMLMMARLSQEYGFHLGSLTHAMEGFKIAPELAAAHVPVSMFGDGMAYKLEVYDTIPMGPALCMRAGVLTSVNTDTFSGIAPLQLDAAKMMRYGVSEADALKAITINPAKQLGIDRWVGTLEAGKDGDVSIWSGHPLSVYSHCDATLINGQMVFERRDAFGVDSKSTFHNQVHTDLLKADLLPMLPGASVYAIIGATVHPVSGPDITSGVVIIRGNRIEAVGGPSTPIPAGAVRVPARGMHVYPGFVDGGSNLGLNEMGEVKQSRDDSENGPFQPDLRSVVAMNPEAVRIPVARCAGITTAQVEHGGGLISGLTGVVDLGGYNREQMSLNDAAMLMVEWPEDPGGAFVQFIPPAALKKQKEEALGQRDAIKEFFAKAQRAMDAGDASDPRLAALTPCLRGERPVQFKVNGERGIKDVLAFAKEFKLKAVIYGGAEAWKVTQALAEAKVPVLYNAPSISCPAEASPYSPLDPYDSPFAAPYVMRQAGVKFGLMTGDSATIHNLANRAGWLCAYGLKPAEAIRAITLDTAQILGVADRVGSLDPGKLANIVLTDGDPLEITTQVMKVWIEGKPVPMTSKFTQMYRKYEARLNGK
jgi:imidazolonepropionase-like amidohydrolase